MFRCYDLVDGRVQSCPEGQLGIIQVYSAPTEEEKRYLVDQCGIDEHTLVSALDEDEISRVEYEHNHIAVILKRPRNFQVDRTMATSVPMTMPSSTAASVIFSVFPKPVTRYFHRLSSTKLRINSALTFVYQSPKIRTSFPAGRRGGNHSFLRSAGTYSGQFAEMYLSTMVFTVPSAISSSSAWLKGSVSSLPFAKAAA